jgi:uncharacterized membrane protein YphA (DoxX/SURF4 family)
MKRFALVVLLLTHISKILKSEKILSFAVSLLRISVGWHFLYEGLVKLADPNWTAAGYLENANWWLAGIFQYMANHPDILQVVNVMNIWALILIGVALMLGVGIRIASIGGIFLLALYYLANPSLIGVKYSSVSSEGSYLIVNKNVIEALVFIVMVMFPVKKQIALQNLINLIAGKLIFSKVKIDGIETVYKPIGVRRSLLQSLFIIPFCGAFALAYSKKKKTFKIHAYTGATTKIVPDKAVSKQIQSDLFFCKIGDQVISKLVLGGGCLAGWQHARDLKYVNELARFYNSQKRIIETLKLSEGLGVNAVNVYLGQMPLVYSYNTDYEGDLKAIVAVAVNEDDWETEVDDAVAMGANLIYIQPFVADRLVKYGDEKVLLKAISYIRDRGVPAGIGCFSCKVVQACGAIGLVPDFYVKAVHPDTYWSAHPIENRQEFEPAFSRSYPQHPRYHDNIFDVFPQETLEVMSKVKVPWIGFKTLASGAIDPSEGFRYAFGAGAGIISVGMFDFQIERNIKTTLEILKT